MLEETPPEETQRELILSLIEITQTSEQRARNTLISCQWNLEYAVALHLAAGPDANADTQELTGVSQLQTEANSDSPNSRFSIFEGEPGEDQVSPSQHPRTTGSRDGAEPEQNLRRRTVNNPLTNNSGFANNARGSTVVSQPTAETNTSRFFSSFGDFIGESFSFVSSFFQTCFTQLWRIIEFVILNFARFLGQETEKPFSEMLTQIYGTENVSFCSTAHTFEEAYRVAENDGKALAVYLHNEDIPECREVCSVYLKNDLVRSYLENPRFIFWGGNVMTKVGRVAATELRARRFPFFTVFVPQISTEASNWETVFRNTSYMRSNSGLRLQKLNSLEPIASLHDLVMLLMLSSDNLAAYDAHIEGCKERHENDRRIREQQDREYEEAMQLDLLREKEREQEMEQTKQREKIREQRRAKKKQMLAEKRELAATLKKSREKIAQRLLEAEKNNPISKTNETTICIKLHSNKRIVRKFSKYDKVEAVFEWAGVAKELDPILAADDSFEIPKSFKLSTSVVGKQLASQQEQTLEEAGLTPNALLLMACYPDDDDDDESASDSVGFD